MARESLSSNKDRGTSFSQSPVRELQGVGLVKSRVQGGCGQGVLVFCRSSFVLQNEDGLCCHARVFGVQLPIIMDQPSGLGMNRWRLE